MSQATVFVIDDDASFLTAVSRLLRAAGFQVMVHQSAQSFLEALSPAMSGCVIVDLQMPDLNGLELQQALARAENPLPVIFLSGHGDIPSTVRAMRSGAEDFLTKTAPREQLLAAVHRAFERDRKEREQREELGELRNRFARLTERELEVLRYVVRGWMNKQIAAELGINERTVKLHRTSVTRKLRAPSVAELTTLARRAGIFS
jgi:FixJ family two-component response regulator